MVEFLKNKSYTKGDLTNGKAKKKNSFQIFKQ